MKGVSSKRYDLNCIECSEPFVATHRDRKYCSQACSEYARIHRDRLLKPYARPRECTECGQTFTAHSASHKYCGDGCKHQAFNRRHKKYQEKWRSENQDKLLDNKRRSNTRAAQIRLGKAQELFSDQNGLCYLCALPIIEKELRGSGKSAIDHDHSCCPATKYCENCIRGLACQPCNLILGHAKDSPERLRLIADNLEKQKTARIITD